MTSYAEMTLARSLSFLADSQSAISNNIANATTTAYKRKSPVAVTHVDDFHSMLGRGMKSITYSEGTDFQPGSRRASNQMSVVLGDGQFFRVQNGNGTFYTRRGELVLDAEGTLVTPNGSAFLGDDGQPIRAGRASEIRILSDGTVLGDVDGAESEIGRFGVFQVADQRELVSVGGSMFYDRAAQTVTPHTNPEVRQGYLEESNVDVLKEMIQMIGVQRTFGATTEALSAYDTVMSSYVQSMMR